MGGRGRGGLEGRKRGDEGRLATPPGHCFTATIQTIKTCKSLVR